MSFLQSAGAGAAAAGAGAAANPMSTGLGHLFGADPSRVSMIADRVGNAANGIATAGGADQGYGGQAAPMNNVLQQLDPTVMRAIMAKFGPAQFSGNLR